MFEIVFSNQQIPSEQFHLLALLGLVSEGHSERVPEWRDPEHSSQAVGVQPGKLVIQAMMLKTKRFNKDVLTGKESHTKHERRWNIGK